MALYLPFDQLYTGYGWGANPVKAADGVKVEKSFYSVTYMDATGKNVLAKEYVTDGERSDTKLWADAYTVKKGSITSAASNQQFKYWVNAGSVETKTIPAGNRNDVVLFESWDNPYTARFVDQFGNVIYSETFTKSDPAVSVPAVPYISEEFKDRTWDPTPSTSLFQNATGDITFRPVYGYQGALNLQPCDDDNDGVIDYYSVQEKTDGKYTESELTIPGYVNGIPVKVINPFTEEWFEESVTTIKVEEGVEIVNANAFAGTNGLKEIYLPNSLEKIGNEALSNNVAGLAFKKVTIYFNGTKAEWDAITKEDGWHDGLNTGSKIVCTDGEYTLERTYFLIGSKYTWNWTSY